jgi:hypothetical protein
MLLQKVVARSRGEASGKGVGRVMLTKFETDSLF